MITLGECVQCPGGLASSYLVGFILSDWAWLLSLPPDPPFCNFHCYRLPGSCTISGDPATCHWSGSCALDPYCTVTIDLSLVAQGCCSALWTLAFAVLRSCATTKSLASGPAGAYPDGGPAECAGAYPDAGLTVTGITVT